MSDLNKRFLKIYFAMYSVVSQNINKKNFFFISLRIKTRIHQKVAIFKIPKNFKVTPP